MDQVPIKVGEETKQRIRYLAAFIDATRAEVVDRAVREFAARHAGQIETGIDHAGSRRRRRSAHRGRRPTLPLIEAADCVEPSLLRDGDTTRRYPGAMTRQATVPHLSFEQMIRRLEEAQVEEREGRLVGCNDEDELRELLGMLRRPA